MEYNKIIAVTGLPGLYELLSSKADGAIVRSLDDKTTRFVSSRIHNFSHLESIEIYTVRDNVNLADVLKAMEASAEKLPDEKDNSSLKSYFSKVYPDMDFDRVYTSDLRKMVKWFVVLKANQIEITLPEEESAQEEEEAKEEVKEVVKEEKPAAPKKKAEKAVKEEVQEEKTEKVKSKPKEKTKPASEAEKKKAGAAKDKAAGEPAKKTTKKKS